MDWRDLYERQLAMPTDIQGHLEFLVDLVERVEAKSVVELGVRSGISTVAFLHALERTGGHLWSCDVEPPSLHFDPSVAPHWTLVVDDDLVAVQRAPASIDLLFIDTSHTFAHTVAELRAYVPRVRPGGWVVAHDTESHPDVAAALDYYFGPGGWENRPGGNGLGLVNVQPTNRSRRAEAEQPGTQTLVTCLFDLERRQNLGNRSLDFYLEHAKYVLGVDQPLVAYVDPPLLEWAWAEREARGLGHLTSLVARPFEALDLHSVVPLTSSFPTFANCDRRKGTPLHQIVEWSKLELVAETIATDPFKTEHFAWIDIALAHVARPPETFPAPTDRVAALQMVAVGPAEIEDKLGFLQYERGRIAGGFLRGSRSAMLELADAFRAELASALASRFRPNDQGILSYLSASRPELFDFYYGDYASILTNWDFIRHDLPTVFLNMAHCREHRLWESLLRICQTVRASVTAGALRLSPDEHARLLDDYHACASESGPQELRDAIRDEFLAGCTQSGYFAEHRSRLVASFGTGGNGAQRASDSVEEPPAVSVVIPVHNGASTLERAVRSALAQTFEDLEVVVVDDGSTDGSWQVASRLADEDPRVRAIRRPAASGGPATPRDEAIAASRGRHVGFLDQDDYWLPEKLARQMPLFDDDDVAVVYSDAYHEDPSGNLNTAGHDGQLPDGDILDVLARSNVVAAPTAVVRRDWIDRVGRFDRHGLIGTDDYYYWLRISLSGGRFAVVREPLAVHHWRWESLGNTQSHEIFRDWHRLHAALAEEFPEHAEVFAPGPYHPFTIENDLLRSARIALCMIVKNEAQTIERCVASVRHLISHWVICDTGSTDGTQDAIRRALHDVPGELHQRPWRDFGENRTELMELARGTADYLLLLDADMTIDQSSALPPLTADAYLLRFAGPMDYAVVRLVRADRAWHYIGATHEYLSSSEPFVPQELPQLSVVHHGDGGAREDKLDRDVRLLEAEYHRDPDNERTVFYLAQTHRDRGAVEEALELFQRRASMGGFEEEAFYAAYQAASLLAARDPERGVGALLAAWQRRPSRAEPLYELACVAREQGWWHLAHMAAERGAAIPRPNDTLFVHRPAYDWGLSLEQSIAAWWLGRPEECLRLSEQLLAQPGLPEGVLASADSNRSLCLGSPAAGNGRPRASTAMLERAIPAIRWARISLDVDPPWPCFNPSIAADEGGFKAIVRTANYEVIDGRYHSLDDDDVIRTINYMVDLDDEFVIENVQPLTDQSGRPCHETLVQGYEDCRLFSWRGRWLASASVRDGNPQGWCEVALLHLDGAAVVQADVLPRPHPERNEKNWMPYAVDDELRFVYNSDPLTLLRWDPDAGLQQIGGRPATAGHIKWRGGSPGVHTNDGTLFLVHELDERGHYLHRFLLIDELELRATSRPFSFTGARVEYSAGMTRRNGDLVLSFGIEDRVAGLAVLPLDAALSLLQPPESVR